MLLMDFELKNHFMGMTSWGSIWILSQERVILAEWEPCKVSNTKTFRCGLKKEAINNLEVSDRIKNFETSVKNFERSTHEATCPLKSFVTLQKNLEITKGQGTGKNLLAITKFRYIEVRFHIFYYYWGKENGFIYRGRLL